MSDKAKRDRGYTVGASGTPEMRADSEITPDIAPNKRLPLTIQDYGGKLKKVAKQNKMKALYQARMPDEGSGKGKR